MGVHADGGLEKSIFLCFKSSKKKSGPNLAVLAPEKDSSEDLGVCGPKIVQKYALSATFWAKTEFLIFQVSPKKQKQFHLRAQAYSHEGIISAGIRSLPLHLFRPWRETLPELEEHIFQGPPLIIMFHTYNHRRGNVGSMCDGWCLEVNVVSKLNG